MVWTIKMAYCFKVEAGSRSEAYAKACHEIKESPGLVIAGVFEGETPKKKSPLAGFLFGY